MGLVRVCFANKPINIVNGRDPSHTSSVLIVDDEAALRAQIRTWVDGFGYRAREAATAGRALATLDDQATDIAICDVRLGGARRAVCGGARGSTTATP